MINHQWKMFRITVFKAKATEKYNIFKMNLTILMLWGHFKINKKNKKKKNRMNRKKENTELLKEMIIKKKTR